MIALAWVLNMQQIKVEKTPEEYELSSLGRSEWQAVSLQKGLVGQVHTASCQLHQSPFRMDRLVRSTQPAAPALG